MLKRFGNWIFTVNDKNTLRKRMIPIHLCSIVQRFKPAYEKDFKTSKKRLEKKLQWTSAIEWLTDIHAMLLT